MVKIPSARILTRVCALLHVAALLLCIIGIATPYWRALHFEEFRTTDDVGGKLESQIIIQGFDEGLWRRCVNSICANINVAGRDWIHATRAFACFGLLSAILSLSVFCIYMVRKKNTLLHVITAVSSIAAAGCLLLSIVIYGFAVKVAISWSYAMVTIAAILFAISGAILQLIYFRDLRGQD